LMRGMTMALRRWLAAFGRLALLVVSLVLIGQGSALGSPDGVDVRGKLAGLRLPLIENQGQVDANVAYYAPTFAGTLFVTQRGELVHALPVPRAGKLSDASRPVWTLTETLDGGTTRPVGTHRSSRTRS